MERKEFRKRMGIGIGNVEGQEQKEWDYEEIEKRKRKEQIKKRWDKIRESKYNRYYKVIKTEELPKYLEKGWREERWRRIARWKLGNEVRESMYWESEEKKKYSVCEYEKEIWEHVWDGCARGKVKEVGKRM